MPLAFPCTGVEESNRIWGTGMTVSGIFGGGALGAIQHRQRFQNISDLINPETGTSQTGQTASGGSQATTGNSQAQNTLSALLDGMTVAGLQQDGTAASQSQQYLMGPPSPPPPGQAGGEANSFASNLVSLLQSVLSGDMTGAQNAATALQSALGGPDSQSASSTSPTTSASTTGSTSTTSGPGTTQSTFLSDLNTLLTAVQSGDTATAQTAANTLVSDLKSQADSSQALPPIQDNAPGHWGGRGGSFRSNLATLIQSVQSGDMTGAQSAATALQNEINGTASAAASASSTAAATTTATASTSSASASSTSSTASTSGSSGTQSTFLADLESLLSAVQSGDATASQTAAGTVMDDLKNQAEAFQDRLASLAAPQSSGGGGAGVGNVLSAYFQWSVDA